MLETRTNAMDLEKFKIVVIGDIGCGKTSILKRLVHQQFSGNYKSTIGVDFMLYNTVVDGKPCTIQFWDIGGGERFGKLTQIFYRGTDGALVVFDCTREDSLNRAGSVWKPDLDFKSDCPKGDYIPSLLLANKADLIDIQNLRYDYPNLVLSKMNFKYYSQLNMICRDFNFENWYLTSAKLETAYNVYSNEGFSLFKAKWITFYICFKKWIYLTFQNYPVIDISIQIFRCSLGIRTVNHVGIHNGFVDLIRQMREKRLLASNIPPHTHDVIKLKNFEETPIDVCSC